MDWSAWLGLLKQYGPVAGPLLAFIWWQSTWINRLLDRHEKAYSGEIQRMHEHMSALLQHVLGKQPSSQNMPTIKDMISDAEGPKKLPGEGKEDKK